MKEAFEMSAHENELHQYSPLSLFLIIFAILTGHNYMSCYPIA